MSAKNNIERALSTWTPLTDPLANKKLFHERLNLISHWHKSWSLSQRREFLTQCLSICSDEELDFTNYLLKHVMPQEIPEFTRVLTRKLSIKIFNYLDPRSLCRCAQVSWIWNYLASENSIWVNKCKIQGWEPAIQIPAALMGFWKNYYVQKIQELRHNMNKRKETPPETDDTPVKELILTPLPKKEIALKTYINHPTEIKQQAWRRNDIIARDIAKKTILPTCNKK